jgi:hypothetical protein
MGVSKRKTPKRKTKGKKRRKQKGGAAKLAQILKASARRQAKRAGRGARSAARYARRNKGRIAAGLAAAGALGLGGLEGMRARQTYNLDRDWPKQNKARIRGDYEGMESSIYHDEDLYIKERRRLQSPTVRFFRGVGNYPYKDIPMNVYRGAMRGARKVNSGARRGARKVRRAGSKFLDFINPSRIEQRRQAEIEDMRQRLYGKRRRRRRKFGKLTKQQISDITLQYLQNNTDKLKELKDYARTGEQCMKDAKTLAGLSVLGTGVGLGYRGYQAYKRDKRKKKRKEAGRKAAVTRRNRKKWRKAAAKRRKRKSSFGKKAKKPSAALRRLCKKHKVRLTVKRGKKRVYKSEKVLKKQCKTAMKRKK